MVKRRLDVKEPDKSKEKKKENEEDRVQKIGEVMESGGGLEVRKRRNRRWYSGGGWR